jgi:hypothetical protein
VVAVSPRTMSDLNRSVRRFITDISFDTTP